MCPRAIAIAALLTLPVAQSLYGADSAPTGLFSTLRLSERSGDITGAEVHIVPNPKGFSAIVQASEGAPGLPEVLEVRLSGTTVIFSVPENSASGFVPGQYRGTVTKKGLQLRGPRGSYENYFLPRKPSFWQ